MTDLFRHSTLHNISFYIGCRDFYHSISYRKFDQGSVALFRSKYSIDLPRPMVNLLLDGQTHRTDFREFLVQT